MFHRVVRNSLTIFEHNSVRTLATSLTQHNLAHARKRDLGRHVYQAFAVKSFIDQYPEWPANKVNDVVQG